MNNFTSLCLNGWRQFADINIDLSSNVNILTGQNGCGKTTLLNLLNNHYGWSTPLVATPRRTRKRLENIWSDMFLPSDVDLDQNTTRVIGHIKYDNGSKCDLLTNILVGPQYSLQYSNAQSVMGLHIPSHRPVITYTNISSLPTQPQSAANSYQEYQQNLLQLYHGHNTNPSRIQKQSVMSFAIFGEGNSSVPANDEMRRWFEGFQDILRKVLPVEIGFERIEIRLPEVVLITRSGDFNLDAMSGGINSLFSVAWQIFMFAHGKEQFSVTFDEPENHLHPSMQRSLLPNLSAAFPNCRFIIATHSPFIVSSFEKANVYGLHRNGDDRIVSTALNIDDLSGTPNDILRDILNVESNLPVWVEEKIKTIFKKSEGESPERRGAIIMQDLADLGIADAIVEYSKAN